MPWKMKPRKNGVFQGWEKVESSSSSSSPTKKAYSSPSAPTNSYAPSDKTGGKPYSKTSVTVKEKPRKNGVYQGTSISVTKNKPGKAKSAAVRISSPSAPASSKPKKNPVAAAATSKETKGRAKAAAVRMMRADRKKSGDFKGKYLGPDEFKGSEAKIAAWKRAGKPDPKKFAKKG